jgi:hypothetical protein
MMSSMASRGKLGTPWFLGIIWLFYMTSSPKLTIDPDIKKVPTNTLMITSGPTSLNPGKSNSSQIVSGDKYDNF